MGTSADPALASIALPGRAARWWARGMHDPFVHFLAIGIALMALYGLVTPPRPAASTLRIELTPDDVRQLQVAWTSKWKRPPTPAEMRGLVDQKVREEVLYREALAMGLDQDDTIVKRRLAQKVEFLTEDVAALRDPTPAELEAWFVSNAVQFATPGHITFRHLYFSPDMRGPRAEMDARAALAQLQEANASGDVAGVGDRFSDRSYYADNTPNQLAAYFGLNFSESLEALPSGTWQGPIESGLGWHLVWIDAASPGSVPTFAESDRAEVKTAWIDVQRAETKRTLYEGMRAKYEVVVPGAKIQ